MYFFFNFWEEYFLLAAKCSIMSISWLLCLLLEAGQAQRTARSDDNNRLIKTSSSWKQATRSHYITHLSTLNIKLLISAASICLGVSSFVTGVNRYKDDLTNLPSFHEHMGKCCLDQIKHRPIWHLLCLSFLRLFTHKQQSGQTVTNIQCVSVSLYCGLASENALISDITISN